MHRLLEEIKKDYQRITCAIDPDCLDGSGVGREYLKCGIDLGQLWAMVETLLQIAGHIVEPLLAFTQGHELAQSLIDATEERIQAMVRSVCNILSARWSECTETAVAFPEYCNCLRRAYRTAEGEINAARRGIIEDLTDQASIFETPQGAPSLNMTWVPAAAYIVASAIITAVAAWAAGALAPAAAAAVVRALAAAGSGLALAPVAATAEDADTEGKQYDSARALADDAYSQHHDELESAAQGAIEEALAMSGLSIEDLVTGTEAAGLSMTLPSIADLASTFSLPATLGG